MYWPTKRRCIRTLAMDQNLGQALVMDVPLVALNQVLK